VSEVAQWVVFLVASLAAIAMAVGVVTQRNPVHAALALVGTLFAVAVLFVMQEAHFVAAVQIIVYAGAIVVLFLFVIMLLGVDKHEVLDETLPLQRIVAGIVGVGSLVVGGILLFKADAAPPVDPESPSSISGSGLGNVEHIGRSLFSDYLWAFEITSVLLVIAVVGAVVLVRRRGPSPDSTPTDPSAADGADSADEKARA
jgi:NADH-quinone oxidoreductase subunit J